MGLFSKFCNDFYVFPLLATPILLVANKVFPVGPETFGLRIEVVWRLKKVKLKMLKIPNEEKIFLQQRSKKSDKIFSTFMNKMGNKVEIKKKEKI